MVQLTLYGYLMHYRYGHLVEVWNLLRGSLPEFKLPEPPAEPPAEGEQPPQDPNAPVILGIKYIFLVTF